MSEIESIKHTNATRAHIPSREEAGFEDGNPKRTCGLHPGGAVEQSLASCRRVLHLRGRAPG